MSAVSAVLLLLKRWLLSALGLLRRRLSCRRSQRRNSGSLLPTSVKSTDPLVHRAATTPAYLPQFSQYSQSQLQTFHSWNSPPTSQLPSSAATVAGQSREVPVTANEAEVEDDFFRDMAPQLRHQRTVLLQPPVHQSQTDAIAQPSRRFCVDSSATLGPTRDLGDLEEPEGSAWEAEEEVDVEEAMRAAREAERKRRQRENEARVARQHEASRSLVATKLS